MRLNVHAILKRVSNPSDITASLPTLFTALLLFWVPVVVFSKLAGEVIEREPIASDVQILQAIHNHATPMLDSLFIFISKIGSAEVVAPVVVLVSALLLYKHMKRQAIILFFSVGGAAVANLVLKLLFHRQRPSLWPSLVTEHSFSFPSGHAMASSALAMAVILLCWQTRWRTPAVVAGVSFALAVSFSRLYLGVHYPTDIVAGWSVSMLWVVVTSSLVSDFPYKLRSRLDRKSQAPIDN